ncbi:hypothetical protein H6P81_002488 [Aristolochia fimbriata]|uniref:Peptidase A1 domain-containing protein n=1 Tax=Aristolochia fimbriata TaxID=158543 RepID=A0AAV7F9X5_ARIFI|nr:hypothetical protein H6P81_002488 [Aristolochia fimbriata]
MASTSASSINVSLLLLIFLSTATAAPLLSTLTKDPKTNQYTATVHTGTPPGTTTLVLDLGFFFSWVDCKKLGHLSSSLPVSCNSSLCASINSNNSLPRSEPACANETCALSLENSFTRRRTARGRIFVEHSLAFPETDGHNPGPLAIIPRFFLSCSPASTLLRGLAEGSSGVIALGRSNFSVPAQISAAFSLPHVFALCLSGSPSAPGVAFFGTKGPHYFLPRNDDASLFLAYTPLVAAVANGLRREYFINVTSVEVNGNPVRSNNIRGFGGSCCQFSTVAPYTVMERSIFRSFAAVFVREAASMNLTRAKPVKPFRVCFSSEGVAGTKAGPAVPAVDLVLGGDRDGVFWRIHGANSMVRVGEDVMCLAFVDGGKRARTPIVIGGYQMEDNLLQFDLEKERLGFSSSLLLRDTTCSNFNFTRNPTI